MTANVHFAFLHARATLLFPSKPCVSSRREPAPGQRRAHRGLRTSRCWYGRRWPAQGGLRSALVLGGEPLDLGALGLDTPPPGILRAVGVA